MPDPASAFGGRKPGDFEFSNYLRKLGGEDFWNELTAYQGRRSTSGPRPGYNYRTKKARDPQSSDELASMLDALYEYWRGRGWSPLEEPTMTGKATDPLLKEAEDIAGGSSYLR
jgi:hypothetical protein